MSVRRALQLKDAEGTECLTNATIFAELERMSAKTTALNKFSKTMASAIICLTTNQKFNFSKYIFDNMVKNLEGKVKFLMYLRFVQVLLDKQVEGMSKHKEDTPLFPTMIVKAQEQVGEGSKIPIDSHHTPTTTQPSTSKPQKKQSRRKQRKDTEDPQLSGPTEPVTDDTENVAILALETTKTSQALEIDSLKRRVKKLEKKIGRLRTHRLRRLYKVGRSARVVSSKDEGLGDQEDASKQERKINEIDQDAEVTLVNETQGRYGNNLMFDIGVLDNEQDMAKKEVDMAEKDVSTADLVTIANVVVSTAEVTTDSTTTTTVDELTWLRL
ncbi:hypothetical protein Tco_1471171 [Tanacetum coccineum]